MMLGARLMALADEIVSHSHPPLRTPGTAQRRSSPALAWIMAAYIVVVVGRIESLFGSFHTLHLARIVAAIAIIAALRHRRELAATAVLSLRPAKFMLIFMALVTSSIVFSALRSGTLGVIEGTVFSVTIATVLIVKTARTWQDVRVMLLGFVVSAVVLAAAAMTTSLRGRAGFTSAYDPNDFAYVLVTLLPVVVTFTAVSRGFARLAYAAVSVWVILTILHTESRGGLLGLLVVLPLLIVLLPKNRRGRLELRPTARRTAGRALAMVVVGAMIWSALPSVTRARLATITSLSSDYNANISGGGRLTIWTQTLPLSLHRPWGWGAASFTAVDGLYAKGRYRAPHNMFLQALIELGFEGLLLFLIIIGSTFRILSRGARIDPQGEPNTDALERSAFARALMVGLCGACVSGFFLSELYSQVLWVLVALACVVGRSSVAHAFSSARDHGKVGSRRKSLSAPAVTASALPSSRSARTS